MKKGIMGLISIAFLLELSGCGGKKIKEEKKTYSKKMTTKNTKKTISQEKQSTCPDGSCSARKS